MTAVLIVACGGAGAIARFLVDGAIQFRRLSEFPMGTLVVNLTGSFALGLIVGLSAPHRTTEVIGVATIGSYTTFSTWMHETHRPAEAGETRLAWINIVVPLVLGLAAVALGRVVGRAM